MCLTQRSAYQRWKGCRGSVEDVEPPAPLPTIRTRSKGEHTPEFPVAWFSYTLVSVSVAVPPPWMPSPPPYCETCEHTFQRGAG
eukprot:scaffold14805_cov68-Phaeocystis_antarctica.AAC.3